MQNRAIRQDLAERRHSFLGPALFAEHELAEPNQSGDHQSGNYGNGKKRLKPHASDPSTKEVALAGKSAILTPLLAEANIRLPAAK